MGRRLVLILLVGLICAACGSGGSSRKGRTVIFTTAGNFPPLTIVGTYSASGCASDARTVVRDAALYYAHFQADGCTSSQLGQDLKDRLTARQRTFLLHNVAGDLQRAFRAALTQQR